jgi:alpha-galactosidase
VPEHGGPPTRRAAIIAAVVLCSLACACAPAWGRRPQRGQRAQTSPAALLAPTPYMGWDTYLGLGGRFSESTVLDQASQLIRLGLAREGYRLVWLDAGWWRGTRNAQGQITVNSAQWPHGIAWLASTLHHAGLRLGLYTDTGQNGCGGAGQGSYGHYQQDIDTFAAWGIDAVKVDFCGGIEMGLSPLAAYSAVHTAIEHNSSHRPMLLSICNFLQPGQYGGERPLIGESAFASYMFGPSLGTSWRTDTDVGFPGAVTFAEVLRNMDADAAAPQAAGPGHWNDPDYLAPDQGLSSTQFRTQMSMWAILAAPLMISDDLARIGGASLSAVSDPEVIAVDQDPAGVQGRLLSASGSGEVWAKPLVGGARAVALLNRGGSARTLTTTAVALGLEPARSYTVRDLWRHTSGLTSGVISARVPGNATVLLRISPR